MPLNLDMLTDQVSTTFELETAFYFIIPDNVAFVMI